MVLTPSQPYGLYQSETQCKSIEEYFRNSNKSAMSLNKSLILRQYRQRNFFVKKGLRFKLSPKGQEETKIFKSQGNV